MLDRFKPNLDPIIEAAIEKFLMGLVTQYEFEMALIAAIIIIMCLGIVLFALISVVACVVVPPIYLQLVGRWISSLLRRLHEFSQ